MKRTTKIIIAFVAVMVATVLLVGAMSANMTGIPNEKLSVVTTNFPAYDFVRAVVGNKAEVKMLVKPGAELHDFEPTPRDIVDIKNSDLFVYNGGESEEWVEGVLEGIDGEGVKTFKMMDAVELIEEDGEEGEYDEHVWTSLKNAVKIINVLEEELAELWPENGDEFSKNAREYTDMLKRFDQKFEEIVQNGKRRVVVFGDRFPLKYFAKDYGLEYLAAFPGCAEETEVDAQTMADLIDKVKAEQIPVVFKLELSSGKIAEKIAEETGAKVLIFNAAHNVSRKDFESGLTYAEIMSRNLSAIREALE